MGSGDWFDKFKKRLALPNVGIQGVEASADHKAAYEYPEKLQKIIEDQGYTPDKICNTDEIGLWWIKNHNRTLIRV